MSFTRAHLSPEERLRIAYAHLILGIEQQHIAMLMAVNMGRVNEAIQAVRLAIDNPKGFTGYEETRRINQRERHDDQTRELFAPPAEES